MGLPFVPAFGVFHKAPIIFVTSCNTDMDELNSIMLGGDAFITKPYHTAILLAKIASLLKRAYPDTQSRHLTYQGVSLSLETGTIEAEGKQTELTKNELKIMYYLLNMPEPSAQEQISLNIYGTISSM